MRRPILIALLLRASLLWAAFGVPDAQWSNLVLSPGTTTGGGSLDGVVDAPGDPGTELRVTIDPTVSGSPNYGYTTVFTGLGGMAGDRWEINLANNDTTPFRVQLIAWTNGWQFAQSGIFSGVLQQGGSTNLEWNLSAATSIEAVGLMVFADATELSAPEPVVQIVSGPLPPLWVVDGTLYRDGAAYRALGMNYFDLFLSMVEVPEPTAPDFRTLEGLRFLGEQGVPFVRFSACGFWPVNWNLYFTDKAEWFRRMDLVVSTAEEVGVGLIPSLFWRYETYPNLVDEYLNAWGDSSSQTRQFMTNYVHEVVGRYKDSPAIWGWEFCNELNLYCDLPNWADYVPPTNEWAGVTGKVTEVTLENKMTYAIAQSAFEAFAQEVRKLDPHRFITTGNGFARPTAWNNAVNNSWTTDTYSQALEAFGWMAPTGSIDMASFHVYIDQYNDPYAGSSGVADILLRYRQFCDLRGQAMFIGEYSHYYANSGFVPGTAAERTNEEALVQTIVDSGADLAAYWVFDYHYGEQVQGVDGIPTPTNDFRWITDLVLEYDAKMRGETPRSPAGVPLGWFDGFGIAPNGSATWAETEILDPNANGLATWRDYYAGTHPVAPNPGFVFTGFQTSENNPVSLSWWGGTNGLTTPYLIESTTNLVDSASWQPAGNKPREPGTNTWIATSPDASPHRCYRVRAIPE